MGCRSRIVPPSRRIGRVAATVLLALLASSRPGHALDPTPGETPAATATPAPPTPSATATAQPTPAADPLCGTTLDGALTLDHDLQGCRGAGFKLLSGALLDCNGHAIVGNGGSYGVLLDTAVGAEVRNCRITGFSRGVRVLGGGSSRVVGNEPYANRNYGIELAAATSGNRIEANFVHDNLDEGIHVGANASGNEIVANQIVRSAQENLYFINCSGNSATGNVIDAGGAAAIFVKHSSDNTFTGNSTTAGLVQVRGNSVGNVFRDARLDGQGFRFEAYEDPSLGWTYPHGNTVDGGSIQHADVCFSFAGAYDNHAAHVIVDRCTPVVRSTLGGQDAVDDTADLCGDGVVSGDELCDLAALNGAATSCCTASCGARASDAVCRPAASECDVAETCAGAHGACPGDAFEPSGAACSDDGKICSADVCDGAGHCTHPAGNAGAICRPAAGPCDVDDRCSGNSKSCGSDTMKPAGTVCRAAAGACDVAETCSGTAPLCPADALRPAGYVCRGAAGACDVAESCTGTGALCPADAFQPRGTVCRLAAGTCDVAASCGGASATCPANVILADGTACSDGNACTGPDACKAGTCVGASSVACTASDSCHLRGTCDPRTGACSDPEKPDGSSCNGSIPCVSGQQCVAGRCTIAAPPRCAACEVCDPGAGCVARPRDGCLLPARAGASKLTIVGAQDPRRDALTWSLAIDHGSSADFGDPLADTGFGLCVFAPGSGAPSLAVRTQAPAGGVCNGAPCWRETADGFRYANGAATPDGATALQLGVSAAGIEKLKLTAKGANLLLPQLPLPPGLVVQLQSPDVCWEARFTTLKQNTARRLRATSD